MVLRVSYGKFTTIPASDLALSPPRSAAGREARDMDEATDPAGEQDPGPIIGREREHPAFGPDTRTLVLDAHQLGLLEHLTRRLPLAIYDWLITTPLHVVLREGALCLRVDVPAAVYPHVVSWLAEDDLELLMNADSEYRIALTANAGAHTGRGVR
jgi:hypothetical protein